MAQQLRELVALAEDLGLFPSTYIMSAHRQVLKKPGPLVMKDNLLNGGNVYPFSNQKAGSGSCLSPGDLCYM